MFYSEYICKALRVSEPTRPLFSFWTHFPNDDLNARLLADASLDFCRTYRPDFLKTMPNGMYGVEDYGCEIDYSGISQGGVATIEFTPFSEVEDWAGIEEVHLGRGALRRELDSLSYILAEIGAVPVIFTVFSPMTIAGKLSKGKIYHQIRTGTELELIHRALALIAADVAALSREAIRLGAIGIFFAHQDTDRNKVDADIFSDFVVPYDYEALAGARDGRFNILHLHGDSPRFIEIAHYPVHAINWHAWETLPSVSAAATITDKCLVGGINRWSITNDDRDEIKRQIDDTLALSGGKNVIITPGCTIRHPCNKDVLTFIRDYLLTYP
jgi:uroporphyrinogen decarboxylase